MRIIRIITFYRGITLSLFIPLIVFFCTDSNSKQRLTDYVDPFIGTDGTGHTFPGATRPFGMVQLSPDTRNTGWENCSGYHSSNPTILGFSHTHLSGTGAMDYGDILVVPTVGKIQFQPGSEDDPHTGYRSSYHHKTEVAEPGYYAVTLEDHGVRVELTTTMRTGFHRYWFPSTDSANIIIDLEHGIGDKVVESGIRKIGPREISGFRRSHGWAKDQIIFFNARFSQDIINNYYFIDDNVENVLDEVDGQKVKGSFSFKVSKDRPLLVKVGISAVDNEGARTNLDTELPGWDFEIIKREASDMWENELSRIEVKDKSRKNKINFYTALYHSMIAPNLYADTDGRYRGSDLQIHNVEKGSSMYTVFSLWDTFRALHPLLTMIKPTLAQDLVRTLITKYEEGGLLPVWELASNETNTMIGYHSISVIADAWAKGLRDFDHDKALDAMVKSALDDNEGLDEYKEKGYISVESENESVSKTLEYAYDDWCIATVAHDLGKTELANQYLKRSKNYRNLFDPTTGFMRGRKFSNWVSPFDPFEVNAIYTEANSWQYSFFAPHDINGLINLMGGDTAFCNRLDSLFNATNILTGRFQPDITGLMGQYAHGNEPSHNFAYLYSYAGQAWKTQEIVRDILDNQYSNQRNGLCGNEDCGQMSAWYVFSALGFYPVVPGKDYYVIGTPLFDEVIIHLENGKRFYLKTENFGKENKYIQSVRLNGTVHSETFIDHEKIMSGGELVFIMGNLPNKEYGLSMKDRPRSNVEISTVTNPIIAAPSRAFYDTMTVHMYNNLDDGDIFYTLDGDVPNRNANVYEKPLLINESTVIKAVVSNTDTISSQVETLSFHKMPFRVAINYQIPYSKTYTAGGKNGLFDSIRGAKNSWGAWQGWEGEHFDATIDLGSKRDIKSVTATFLQNPGSWIWLPKSVMFYSSEDGKEFVKYEAKKHNVSLKIYEPQIVDFSQIINNPVRYIRIKAKNILECPDWHPGAGGPSWLFIDEITFNSPSF